MFPGRLGIMPYMFLVYLILPVIYIMKESGWKETAGYGLLLLFLISYRQLYWLIDKRGYSWWLGIQMAIILTLSIWFNPNIMMMGFFPAHFIGWYSNKKNFYTAMVTLVLIEAVPILYVLNQGETWRSLLHAAPFIIVMLLSPFGIRSMNRRMELEQKLDEANGQISELIKREERVRIARDLHDTLGHTLSLITLKSQLVQKLSENHPERAGKEAEEIEQTSRSALKQVRELISNMRALTMAEALLEIQHTFKAAGIDCSFEGDPDCPGLSLLEQNILGMCLREAATNIVKHSQARSCSIKFREEGGHLNLYIRDNGIGVSPDQKFGNGLQGMAERIAIINGRLSVENEAGTCLFITLPIVIKQESKEAVT